MKKNEGHFAGVSRGVALGLWSMTALFIGLCGVALVLNPFAPQGSYTTVSIAQDVTSRQAASITIAPRQANTTNNNADCLTVVKTNKIFGIGLFNSLARAENKTCPNARIFADVPVAYPPTFSAQFERTIKTVKRGPPASV